MCDTQILLILLFLRNLFNHLIISITKNNLKELMIIQIYLIKFDMLIYRYTITFLIHYLRMHLSTPDMSYHPKYLINIILL